MTMKENMTEPRIGVYICNCGTNIAKVVNCDRICDSVSKFPGVAVARTYKYMCSNPGQDMIVQDVRQLGLDRVVVPVLVLLGFGAVANLAAAKFFRV